METENTVLEFGEVRAIAETLGPLATFSSVDTDGTPHMVPVIASWIAGRLVFGTHAMSHKVKNLLARPNASVQFVTNGEQFPDALLIKGTARVVHDDGERREHWESGFFPFLPMMYGGPDDAMLRFVEFTPRNAFIVRNGGRGPVERWRGHAAA